MTNDIIKLLNEVSIKVGALAPENNGGVPFKFRGVDATVAHLAPAMKEAGIVVIPEVLDRQVSRREVGNSKVITTTDLLTRFTFYAPDGSSVSATTAGLADDFSDRSAAQAQSVAFRVALLQVFKLPTTDKEPEVNGEEIQATIAKDAAEKKVTRATATPKAKTAAQLVKEVQEKIADADTPYDGQAVNDLGVKHSGGKQPAEWMKDAGVLQKILDSIKAGELA